jgi:hypothetical protein
MERGLLWLPLLALFTGLAWAGWHEYRKVEAYRRWATGFERAKYDIYAALGQTGNTLTWGQPTRQGPIHLQTIDLSGVDRVELTVAGQPLAEAVTPRRGRIELRCSLKNGQIATIPFTEIALARDWLAVLQAQLAEAV